MLEGRNIVPMSYGFYISWKEGDYLYYLREDGLFCILRAVYQSLFLPMVFNTREEAEAYIQTKLDGRGEVREIVFDFFNL